MHLNQYQELALKASVLKTEQDMIDYGVLNLASEAGEVAGKFAKALRDGHEVDRDAVISELGDVLWSMAALCAGLQTNLDEVAYSNIQKVQDRTRRGVVGGSGDNR